MAHSPHADRSFSKSVGMSTIEFIQCTSGQETQPILGQLDWLVRARSSGMMGHTSMALGCSLAWEVTLGFLLVIQGGSYLAGTGTRLAPRDPVKQAVDIAYGDLPVGEL